jgi:hypothetical protein
MRIHDFSLRIGKKSYNYKGEEVVLIKLKQIFCQKVF